MGMQLVRTPIYLKYLEKKFQQEMDSFFRAIKPLAIDKNKFSISYKEFDANASDENIENIRKNVLESKKIEISNRGDLVLYRMIKLGRSIGENFSQMSWMLIETSSEIPFITSDNFVNIISSENGFYTPGMISNEFRLFFPLSKKLGLLIYNNESSERNKIVSIFETIRDERGNIINIKDFVRSINKKIFIISNKWIFASSNSEKLKNCFNNILSKARNIEENFK